MSDAAVLGRQYSSDSIYECVRRRDGTHVWRSVGSDGRPTVTGGNRFIHMGFTATMDAEDYASGTRVKLAHSYTVTRIA